MRIYATHNSGMTIHFDICFKIIQLHSQIFLNVWHTIRLFTLTGHNGNIIVGYWHDLTLYATQNIGLALEKEIWDLQNCLMSILPYSLEVSKFMSCFHMMGFN